MAAIPQPSNDHVTIKPGSDKSPSVGAACPSDSIGSTGSQSRTQIAEWWAERYLPGKACRRSIRCWEYTSHPRRRHTQTPPTGRKTQRNSFLEDNSAPCVPALPRWCRDVGAGAAAGPVGPVRLVLWLMLGLCARFRLWLLVAVGLGRLGCWLGWDPLGTVCWWRLVGRPAPGCLVGVALLAP